MSLSEKLSSISREQTVFELNQMLDNAHVSISWSCQRLVSIDGYEGTVDINDLVQKYLDASPRVSAGINLKERLDFYNLWTKVYRVCRDVTSLNDTWFCGYLVPVKEFVQYGVASPSSLIINAKVPTFPSKKELCFSFSPGDFKQLWPDQQPRQTYGDSVCVATKQMVQEAFQRNQINL
jgi:hypothetical protein